MLNAFLRPTRYDLNQASTVWFSPIARRRRSRVLWSNASNAALRSNRTISTPRSESTACIRSSCIHTNAVLVLCLGRYVLWNGSLKPLVLSVQDSSQCTYSALTVDKLRITRWMRMSNTFLVMCSIKSSASCTMPDTGSTVQFWRTFSLRQVIRDVEQCFIVA